MIVRSKPGFRDIVFAVNGSILPRIAPHLVAIALISVLAVLAAMEHPGIFARISAVPFTLIGIALSVFMSFRNSACYERWWEGRELWGKLIIACRSFARQTSTLDEEERRVLLRGLCGFCAGLAARLRGEDELVAIGHWCDIDAASGGPNPTNVVLNQIGTYCLALMKRDRIEPIHYSVLEGQLSALSDVQGGCERIASTPVPFAYSLLLHRTALIFCVTLPFALAGSLDWWTLLPVLLVAYTFFGLDALGHQLEDPFGLEPNALPLDAMRRMIEREILFLLGERDLPAPIEARDNVLK
ncbi:MULTISPECIES: bestrophin family protein [Bradyrhizobium]|jgi:ion channel-forming bestrophin family protein|uniref:bestrophin family protein n=1 Tax=Bradyrhizobium TaxID=374 RepID=UPI0004883DD8|nr:MULTISPECIES: bestrophin family protein [Bradyrhizobium]MCS3450201.1 putative membrane protein [Bradyrhizobium elkanii]MCS3558655.1 putative membrane protein [Bradyrhizobium elkanii]MCW2151498.1 putative membrane protein [Bradyrhizobium elkanii]MCW2358629.1 putative membrane protein [Bradyrhizobium elkanii]MCW2375229.1 putative membrane protein [Bradyrhizobium elkanii]